MQDIMIRIQTDDFEAGKEQHYLHPAAASPGQQSATSLRAAYVPAGDCPAVAHALFQQSRIPRSSSERQ